MLIRHGVGINDSKDQNNKAIKWEKINLLIYARGK